MTAACAQTSSPTERGEPVGLTTVYLVGRFLGGYQRVRAVSEVVDVGPGRRGCRGRGAGRALRARPGAGTRRHGGRVPGRGPDPESFRGREGTARGGR